MDKKILLSFDIEEFDIVEEYGQEISDVDKFGVSLQGLKNILKILDGLKIRATFFVTANFALRNKEIVKEVAKKHEVGSHSFYHSSFDIEDLKNSREVLEKIIGKRVLGFRMPRLVAVSETKVKEAGYEYNSSMSPSYMPGRYNNFFKKRGVYWTNGLFNVPTSVTPLIRFPLSWLTLKNIPASLFRLASLTNLNKDGYLNLYLHPWEFADLGRFNLPFYVKRHYGEKMCDKLKDYLIWLKRKGAFITFREFMALKGGENGN